jgi:hypothetical protein
MILMEVIIPVKKILNSMRFSSIQKIYQLRIFLVGLIFI